ncbi:MAG: A24 family peptidase [Candidatus Binatia bacterium]
MELSTIAVIGVSLTACIFDLRTRRIPNLLTLVAAVAAWSFFLAQGGLSALGWSVTGWLLGVLMFFPFFLLGGMGAGDVKLLGALGAWLGPLAAIHLAFYTAIAGGVMALIVVLARGYLGEAFLNIWLLLTYWRVQGLHRHPTLTLEESRAPRLAYAIPIAAGAVATLWWR